MEGFVVLLSHMRSGSTLVSHLLTESPEILGEGEQLRNYAVGAESGDPVIPFLRGRAPLDPQVRFLYDKVLHDLFGFPNPTVSPCRFLILLRDPASSHASIERMLCAEGLEREFAAFYASRYLLTRLTFLEATVQWFKEKETPYLRFNYETLLKDPTRVLAAIQSFLGLRTELSTAYSMRPWTGRPGAGDPGPNIRKGIIDASLIDRSVPADRAMGGLESEIEAAFGRLMEMTRDQAIGSNLGEEGAPTR